MYEQRRDRRWRSGNSIANLPEWDLSDLYPGRDSEALKRDLTRLADDAEAFRERYQGHLADLSGGAALGAAIETYERLQEQSGRIISYASLVHAGNLADPEIGRFFQTMQERINAVSTTLLFFTLELNRTTTPISRKGSDLAHCRPWLRDTRVGHITLG
jgi:oligoendopeptidase F